MEKIMESSKVTVPDKTEVAALTATPIILPIPEVAPCFPIHRLQSGQNVLWYHVLCLQPLEQVVDGTWHLPGQQFDAGSQFRDHQLDQKDQKNGQGQECCQHTHWPAAFFQVRAG